MNQISPPGEKRNSRYPIGEYAAKLLVVLLLLITLDWNRPLQFLNRDSDEFQEFADNLPRYLGEPESLSQAFVLRAPGYPLLLAAAKALAAGDLYNAVTALHASFAVVALLSVVTALSPVLPVLASGAIFCLLPFLLREIFPGVMSEWVTVMGLLIVWSTWIMWLTTRSMKALSLMALSSLVLTVVKPVFIFLCVIPIILALIGGTMKTRGVRFIAISLILSPLLFLAILNQKRFGVFSPSPAAPISLIGVTSSLAAAPVYDTDPAQIQTLLNHLNSHRTPVDRSEFPKMADLESNIVLDKVCINYQTALDVRRELQVPWKDFFAAITLYNKRVIASYPALYHEYVQSGLSTIMVSILTIISTVACSFYLIRYERFRAPAIAMIAFVGLHLISVTIFSFLGIIHNRYYHTTYFPLVVISVFSAACVVRRVQSGGFRKRYAALQRSNID